MDLMAGKTGAPFPWKRLGSGSGSDAYLLFFPGEAVLWDAGFAWYGPEMAQEVRAGLGGARLGKILLSHSHYDHVGAVPYIKEAFPDAEVIAAPHAAATFLKEKARRSMRALDDSVAARSGHAPCDDRFECLHADRTVEEGDEIELGGVRARVVFFPGHTRDCIGFYFPDTGFLLGSETLGVPRGKETVIVSPLFSAVATAESLAKALRLDPQGMLLSHGGAVEAKDCRWLLTESRRKLSLLVDSVLAAAREGKTEEELAAVALEQITASGAAPAGTSKAHIVNAGLSVRAILREYGEGLLTPANTQ